MRLCDKSSQLKADKLSNDLSSRISIEFDRKSSFVSDGNLLKAPESIFVKKLNERSNDFNDFRPSIPPNDDDVTVPVKLLLDKSSDFNEPKSKIRIPSNVILRNRMQLVLKLIIVLWNYFTLYYRVSYLTKLWINKIGTVFSHTSSVFLFMCLLCRTYQN